MNRSRMVLMASAVALVLFLEVCVLSTVNATPAKAASTSTQPFTVARVWTRNCQGQDTDVFSPGQCIQYAVSVDNELGESIEAQFVFDAYPTGPYDYADKRIYYWNSLDHNVHVPVNVGIQYYDSQPTVPEDAASGSYTIKIDVSTLYPAPSYADEGTAQFTVS